MSDSRAWLSMQESMEDLKRAKESAVQYDMEKPAPRAAEPLAPAAPLDPKAKFGATKPNLALVPGTACCAEALALEDGAMKYGPFNWRYSPVEAMTYLAAAMRHLQAYIDGQDFTSDTLVHNLGAVRACCAIVLDAGASGTLVDNRPARGRAAEVQEAGQAFKKEHWPERRIDWKKGRP